jgi:hypothetical protein
LGLWFKVWTKIGESLNSPFVFVRINLVKHQLCGVYLWFRIPRFRSFLCLETPRNLKLIFITLYCLQKPSKNHWYSIFISLILHLMSWFVDLHDLSLQNTYGVAWFRIKVNYNDSSENNTICSLNHWQFL